MEDPLVKVEGLCSASSFEKPKLQSCEKKGQTVEIHVSLKIIFTFVPCILMLSNFYLPTDDQKSCFKRILKFTLKQLLHVSVQSPSSWSVLFELAKVTVIKIITHTHTNTNKDLIKYAATPPDQPQRCILIDYFNNYNFIKLK